jgi:hypothetical protein
MITRITAALVREQGVNFAVVLVRSAAMNQPPASKNQLAAGFQPIFPGNHIVLCAQDSGGRPTYYGRPDIVRFLSGIFFEQLPWAEYGTAA